MSNRRIHSTENRSFQVPIKTILVLLVLLVLLIAGLSSIKTIRAGHVGVATLFGDVRQQTYEPGFHFVNPLYRWTSYDVREKTHKETIGIPSQDQLITEADISVQFRVDGAMANQIISETGRFDDLVNVHLIPNVRSIAREQGKSIEKAEEFYLDRVQSQLESSIETELQNRLAAKGIIVEAVLLRRFELPSFIAAAIEEKKEREQAAERQLAELERFKTEQEQLIATADAEKQAAVLEAERLKLIADAQAYEIKAINEAIAENPAYIQLKALEALGQIAKDPAAKIYFLNDQSPVPLLHFGETQGKTPLKP
eukprot:g15517.t1